MKVVKLIKYISLNCFMAIVILYAAHQIKPDIENRMVSIGIISCTLYCCARYVEEV